MKHAVKQERGQHTALEQENVEQKEPGRPLFRRHFSHELLIVVENKHAYGFWDVIPLQGELDKVMSHTAISIGKVDEIGYNLPLLFLGFAQGFSERKRVLKTARHTCQEAFLDFARDIGVIDHVNL